MPNGRRNAQSKFVRTNAISFVRRLADDVDCCLSKLKITREHDDHEDYQEAEADLNWANIMLRKALRTLGGRPK
jgi:hypothetical protein